MTTGGLEPMYYMGRFIQYIPIVIAVAIGIGIFLGWLLRRTDETAQ